MRMLTGVLYSNCLSATATMFVLARPSKDGAGATDGFQEMRAALDELVKIEEKTRPWQMDVSSIEAATAIA